MMYVANEGLVFETFPQTPQQLSEVWYMEEDEDTPDWFNPNDVDWTYLLECLRTMPYLVRQTQIG